MYCVFQFSDKDGGSVSLGKNDWLTPRKNEVFWPPIKQSKAFNQLLVKNISPDLEKWKILGVQRVFYETDDLEKAKRKLKLSEETSDMQTEAEEDKAKGRKKKKTRRLYNSSSEEEDQHIKPPPLKKKFEIAVQSSTPERQPKSTTKEIRSFPENIRKVQETNISVKETPAISDCNADVAHCSKNIAADPVPEEVFMLNISDISLQSNLLQDLEQHAGLANNFIGSPNIPFQPSIDCNPSASVSCAPALTGFQSKVLSLMSVIKTQNEQILDILKQNNCKGSLNPVFKFPLKNDEELNATEALLSNKEEYYANLVSYYKTLGGRDISSKISRIMKFTLTDKLAEQYNFYGKRSNKKAFCELRLRDCVVEGVVTTTSGSTVKDIEDSIKIWLKHAPERVKKVVRRQID